MAGFGAGLRSVPLAVVLFALATFGTGIAAPASERFVAHGGAVRDLAVTADGRALVSGGFDYAVVLWERATGTPRARVVAHDGPVNDVIVLPGGAIAASAGDDGAIVLLDIGSGAVVARLFGHEAKVVALAARAGGEELASAGWDGTVRLWSIAERRERTRFGDPDRRYTGVAFLAEDGLVAADHTGSLTRWDGVSGRVRWRTPGNGFPTTRLLARGDLVISGSIDGSVRGWNAEDGRERFRLEGQEKPVLSLALSDDGAWLASGTAAGTIYLWHVAEQRGERVLRAPGGAVWSLAFAPDGRTLYSGHGDGAIRVWDISNGQQIGGPHALQLAASERLLGDERGAQLFRKCIGCHSLTPDDEHKAGPTFYHLIGRRAGTVPGYPYSEALRRSGIVWTEETLGRLFELGPEAFVPGSRMPLQRVPDPQDRAALVAYIARISAREQASGSNGAESGR
ncbi:Cytochrome c2 [bacterium HR40]|nr:Cytochrome c2 [bacterium HR40]